MKKIITLLLFLFTFISWSQSENPSFFVQIPNSNYVPKVSHTKNGIKIAKTKTNNRLLNNIISSYKIYRVEKVFKNTKKAELKNRYLIECNDIKLMNKLEKSFSNLYYNIENGNEGKTLGGNMSCPLPDDFGTTGGNIQIQEELNYIRAPEAWCITEGKSDVVIGISDEYINFDHEDIKFKTQLVYGDNSPLSGDLFKVGNHGMQVASIAAGDTNNSKGMSAIGYKSSMYNSAGKFTFWVTGVDVLSQLQGVKVINTSWSNSSNEPMYDEVINDRGIVVVASAGNSHGAAAEKYVYPAAFKDVISVGSIAHETNTWKDPWGDTWTTKKDHHLFFKNGNIPQTLQHNDSIDIVAPAIGILQARRLDDISLLGYRRSNGTSYASPIVSGTIALMFDVNYCLKPKEIESILKLTAVKIDNLPQNMEFYGKLGAGKLDAYEAVKMANDMAMPFGKVEVKDRILYRWFYKLETAPYEIEMTNNDVTGNARLKFRARKNITIKSGRYYPQTGGRVNLKIDKDLVLDNCTPRPTALRKSVKDKSDSAFNVKNDLFDVYPTAFDKYVTISKKEQETEEMSSVAVYDILGKEIYKQQNINGDLVKLNLEHLQNGIYLVKIFNNEGVNINVKKIVKN